jgi:hypothetical protein
LESDRAVLTEAGFVRREESETSPEAGSPTFLDLADSIRVWGRIPEKLPIHPETLFERDLGIGRDDGGELLQEAERRFGGSLDSAERSWRDTFGLAPDEYRFHGEGHPWLEAVRVWFGGHPVAEWGASRDEGSEYFPVNRPLRL